MPTSIHSFFHRLRQHPPSGSKVLAKFLLRWILIASLLPCFAGKAWAVSGFVLTNQIPSSTSSTQTIRDCSNDQHMTGTDTATQHNPAPHDPLSILLIGGCLFAVSSLHARRKARSTN